MKENDRLLQLNLCFKLPADFKGDLNDALEAILKYRRGEKNHDKDFKADPDKNIYNNWWDMVHETDRVLYGSIKYAKYTGDSENPWKDLPL